MKLGKLIVLFLCFFPFNGAFSKDCKEGSHCRADHSDVGPSCTAKENFPANFSIKPGEIYIKTKLNGEIVWKSFNEWDGTTPPTSLRSSPTSTQNNNDDNQHIFELIYVADLRHKTDGFSVLGIVAIRSVENAKYPRVGVFRNSLKEYIDNEEEKIVPEMNFGLNTRLYQGYLKNPVNGTPVAEMRAWLDVPNYSSKEDNSRRYFIFDNYEEDEKFWKSAMKLRVKNSGIACVGFHLAHTDYVTSIKLRSFLQHKDKKDVDKIKKF